MKENRLEFKRIKNCKKNPFFKIGQKIVFDNATQEIMICAGYVAQEYALDLDVEFEEDNEEG